MINENYSIRKMLPGEIAIALDFAAKEGWNPGIHDAESFYAADPSGFFIGLIDDKPVSCISAVAYDKDFGFLGLYIVKPEFREKGYGIEIWKKALSYLKTQTVGLDGVEAQQRNYKKSGFMPEYKNIRYKAVSKKFGDNPDDILPLSKIGFDKLAFYDDLIFPAKRHDFLRSWISQKESFAFGVLRKDVLVGYGVIRKCISGYKIGPLFADDEVTSDKIFMALNNSIELGNAIFLDVPDINIGALKLVKKHKMEFVFETARMYNKKAPRVPIEKIFGVTTLEIG